MRKSVLYVGQAYYNHWYLSRELRKLGWRADLVNIDPGHGGHYHGEDRKLTGSRRRDMVRDAAFYAWAATRYDIFHFANAGGLRLGDAIGGFTEHRFSAGDEIRLLKKLGKKIVYTNNGCLDGVAQSSFRAWGPYPTCDDCVFQNVPSVCSDEGNLAWGVRRNELADYQALLLGNRADFNIAPTVHESPEIYCLDTDVWRPDLEVPDRLRLDIPASTVKIYHSVGNADTRSQVGTRRNTKSTHIYVPLVEQLKAEGHDCELMFFTDVPNLDVRFYMAQSDIVVDMLTAGYFGATTREAMMLGKPVVVFMREEFMEQARREIPDYVDELPVISATPETVHDVLVELINDPARRAQIGARSREFAVKWHGAQAAARRWDDIYRSLLDGTVQDAPWSKSSTPAPASPQRVNPTRS